MATSSYKILVTGASGYIASHIIKQLQHLGYRVRGTVRSIENKYKVSQICELYPQAKYPLQLVEADLLKADTWHEAVHGCTHVIHTASPVPLEAVKNENDVIVPAVEGTLAVLRACQDAKTVKRVILTSSTAAITGGIDTRNGDATFSEENWTDPLKTRLPYVRSKTLAEKEAWKFISQLPKRSQFEMAVINPSVVMGPLLCANQTATMELLSRLMTNRLPLIPHINMTIVDVRDVAAAHVAAMTVPETAGHRHVVAPHNIWLKDIAEILRTEFQPLGYHIPRLEAPYFIVKVWSMFDERARLVLMNWGVTSRYEMGRMHSVLGIEPYPIRDTLIDMAHSMIRFGFIEKTKEYLRMNVQQ
ncbi:hypothetical protein LSH36_434g02048 [Paralvinella palmiformis]|uniref:NAD-dependent epimerase/dehydratase domain-containing protein n=1 Tax=Paralvinella palmiformis TaxID=53620 RepID=A0AAD9MZG5_9ANNE|nr:hypothetical protein LSH36_434g02048 [Paralvinella palmiformis]